MRRLSEAQRKLLQPLATAICDAVCQIRTLSDQQLRELSEAAYAASDTNCGWDIFAAAKIILPETRLERQTRDRAALDAIDK